MTLDTATITQLAVGGVFLLLQWLIRDKVAGVQKTLDSLVLGHKSLELSDAQTDKEVALQGGRIGVLEEWKKAADVEKFKFRSDMAVQLGRVVEDAKKDLTTTIDSALKAALRELREEVPRTRGRRG